jgi:hypothetical protein
MLVLASIAPGCIWREGAKAGHLFQKSPGLDLRGEQFFHEQPGGEQHNP